MNTIIVNLALNLLLNLFALATGTNVSSDPQVEDPNVEVMESSSDKGKVTDYDLIL